ncbi:MAG: hypothetical protein JWN85_2445 [Gammaproteobacteria bacterium]|nr:hypothetical protein [Gammaproteobacteria bacterium]
MGRESLLSIFQRNSDRAGKRQLLNVRSFDFERRLWRSSEGSKGREHAFTRGAERPGADIRTANEYRDLLRRSPSSHSPNRRSESLYSSLDLVRIQERVSKHKPRRTSGCLATAMRQV